MNFKNPERVGDWKNTDFIDEESTFEIGSCGSLLTMELWANYLITLDFDILKDKLIIK